MGLYMGLGMDLLASTFDVESVVFLKRGLHFLAFYGAGGRVCENLLVSTFDVESLVFLKRGLHFLVFYGLLYRFGDGLVDVIFRC